MSEIYARFLYIDPEAEIPESKSQGKSQESPQAGEVIDVYIEDLLCPITKQLLVGPVIAPDGYTYSAKAIAELVEVAKAKAESEQGVPVLLSPVTKQPISLTSGFTTIFRPNRAIDYILRHPFKATAQQAIPEASAEDFLCPIGHTIFTDPIVEQDGRTYEFMNMHRWVESQSSVPTLPMDRQSLNLHYSNHVLKSIIKRFLLAKGIFVGVSNLIHREAIQIILSGSIEGLEKLVATNSELNLLVAPLNSSGWQMAHIAASLGKIAVLKWLDSKGVKLAECITPTKTTPLHSASLMGHTESALYLHSKGLNVKAATVEGHLPIHLAALGGHSATVAALLQIAQIL